MSRRIFIFNVNQWRSIANTQESWQRLNRYRVMLPVPAGLSNQQSVSGNRQKALDTARFLECWASSTDLAGVAMQTRAIVRYGFGPVEKKPVSPMFNDIMVTFYMDGSDATLQYFHDWFNLICPFNMSAGINGGPSPVLGTGTPATTTAIGTNNVPNTVYELQYKGQYSVDAQFTLVDVTGTDVYSLILRECYPVSLPEIKMSYQPQPMVAQVAVEMTFFDWFYMNPNGGQTIQANSGLIINQ